MATLNRFPLLGLWAREAALRIGFDEGNAEVVGHAYAVLYAIRANSPVRATHYTDAEAPEAARVAKAEATSVELLEFADDKLQVSRNWQGQLIGRVGNAEPQTPQSYRYKIARKFPAGSYEKLQTAFSGLLSTYTPEQLNTKLVYQLYDQWKKACASGRMVDLDRLATWCQQRKAKNEEQAKKADA